MQAPQPGDLLKELRGRSDLLRGGVSYDHVVALAQLRSWPASMPTTLPDLAALVGAQSALGAMRGVATEVIQRGLVDGIQRIQNLPALASLAQIAMPLIAIVSQVVPIAQAIVATNKAWTEFLQQEAQENKTSIFEGRRKLWRAWAAKGKTHGWSREMCLVSLFRPVFLMPNKSWHVLLHYSDEEDGFGKPSPYPRGGRCSDQGKHGNDINNGLLQTAGDGSCKEGFWLAVHAFPFVTSNGVGVVGDAGSWKGAATAVARLMPHDIPIAIRAAALLQPTHALRMKQESLVMLRRALASRDYLPQELADLASVDPLSQGIFAGEGAHPVRSLLSTVLAANATLAAFGAASKPPPAAPPPRAPPSRAPLHSAEDTAARKLTVFTPSLGDV